MLEIIIIWALANVAIHFSLWKWKWFEFYEMEKPSYLAWIPRCDFCFGLRMALLEAILYMSYIEQFDIKLLISAFAVGTLSFLIYKFMHR